ncbi:hypothetical protein JRO89_XS08G0193800 [Xanthoceras sorbifolium]|uniref:Uncharacterized protein n=1 Tax=Xanthoceras sorbifolium TaxID=99658 RepID=A0ABQ8HQG9_9ROSI|nr:hypothetical protein JRO89_XS08G0193800 [Xanthoceras sorbifolium]
MASVSRPPQLHHHIDWNWSSSGLPKTTSYHVMPRVRAGKIAGDGGRSGGGVGRSQDQVVHGQDLVKKPVISVPEDDEREDKGGSRSMDWEDQILTETVPLVGLVRRILHSRKYKNGERLSPDHEKIIAERLLPFHPKRRGCFHFIQNMRRRLVVESTTSWLGIIQILKEHDAC